MAGERQARGRMAYCGKLLRRAALVCLAVAALPAAPAFAEKRIALVIGNGDYRSAATLPNPRNDASDVAAALRRSGFETDVGFDLDKAGMDAAAIRFARAARDADVAMFYYSGHAMQFAGANYLMPVDARLTDEADLRLMLKVDDVVADLQQAKNLRILVLDSCRDNPLAEGLKRSIGATRAAGLQRGLARIDTPQGMIVAYATQAGRTADDGGSRNSPYTRAFLGQIEAVEEIGTVFRRISADVYNSTQQKQLPELSLSLIGEFYLNGRPTGPGPAQADVAALQKQLQAIQEQLKAKSGPAVAAVTPTAPVAVPSSAPPDEALPSEIPVDPAVLARIENHPFFANAPPVGVATFTADNSTYGRGVVNGAMTISESATSNVSRRLRKHVIRTDSQTRSSTRHRSCVPECASSGTTVSLSAANGLISLGYRSVTALPGTKSKYVSLTRLLQVTNFSGHVYPVEVGNRFSYEEITETKAPSNNDESVAKNACNVTRKFEAKSFHPDLTGAAYLVICEVQTVYKKNSAANSKSQSRNVYFEDLGIWSSGDPIAPKERIMQADVYGSLKDWTYSGSDRFKSFTLLR
jgi:hypothetical protein